MSPTGGKGRSYSTPGSRLPADRNDGRRPARLVHSASVRRRRGGRNGRAPVVVGLQGDHAGVAVAAQGGGDVDQVGGQMAGAELPELHRGARDVDVYVLDVDVADVAAASLVAGGKRLLRAVQEVDDRPVVLAREAGDTGLEQLLGRCRGEHRHAVGARHVHGDAQVLVHGAEVAAGAAEAALHVQGGAVAEERAADRGGADDVVEGLCRHARLHPQHQRLEDGGVAGADHDLAGDAGQTELTAPVTAARTVRSAATASGAGLTFSVPVVDPVCASRLSVGAHWRVQFQQFACP